MTETEWLTSENPVAMLKHIEGKISHHKRRCWVEACRKACPDLPKSARYNLADRRELEAAVEVWAECMSAVALTTAVRATLLREIVGNPFRPINGRCLWCGVSCNALRCWRCGDDVAWLGSSAFGNILAIATAIDAERRFEDMPILADALEDAGCDNVEILNHCRGLRTCRRCKGKGKEDCMVDAGYNNPLMQRSGWQWCYLCNDYGQGPTPGQEPLACSHVRGCWVLDLLLSSGKESI